MKLGKKVIGLLLATSLTCMGLTGCGTVQTIDETAIAMTVNGEEIDLGLVNFYLRYNQASMEYSYVSVYGEDMWEIEYGSGSTYEDVTKEGLLDNLEALILIRQHAESLGVELTDEEMEYLESAAEQFIGANTAGNLEIISGTIENAMEIMELTILETLCYNVIIEGLESQISEEEVKFKGATYVIFPTTTAADDGSSIDLTEEELVELEAEAESLRALIEEGDDLYTIADDIGYFPLAIYFNMVEESILEEELLEAMDALEEGELTEVIKTESAYFVAQLTDEYSDTASLEAYESALSELQSSEYMSVLEGWMEETETVINQEACDTIDFANVGVTTLE